MHSEDLHNGGWFEAIFDEVADALIITDLQLTIHNCNKSALELFNFGLADSKGKKFEELFWVGNPDFFTSIHNQTEIDPILFENILINKSSFDVKIKRKLLGGNYYLLFFLYPSKASEVSIPLKESEKKYRRLFESILEGIFIFDAEGRIIDANLAATKIYRMSHDELVKLSIEDLFPHQSKEQYQHIWQEFLNKGYLEGFYKFIFPNGEIAYIEFKSITNFLPGFHISVFSDVTEKTKIEKALRSSEANLKAIFDNTRQQIILLDNDYRVVTFNEAAQIATQQRVNRNLEIGELIYNYGQEGDEGRFGPIYDRVRNGETIFEEYYLDHFKDSDNWIEVGFIPVFDEKKNYKGTVLSINNITLRKKAELNLLESEARFRTLVQNSSDIITILDHEANIKYTSASIEKILGYKDEILIGRSFLSYIHEDDRSTVRKTLIRISEGEQYIPVLEYRFLHSDGYYVYLETTCNNLFSNQHIQGIVLNTRDITERKYQEENLLLLERAIDSSSNGIIISDPNQPDNPIIYANKAFEQITGYGYFDIIGKNCRYLQRGDKDQPEIDEIRNAINVQKEVSVIVRNYKKDGSLFWNQLSISPVFNRDGELANYIGVINDITQRKISEDALLEISQGISFSKEHDIYCSIITHIALRLQMEYVLVGEYGGDKMTSKAFFKDGQIIDNIDYPLYGTPCYEVLQSGNVLYYDSVAELFPVDTMFKAEGIYSYMGIPLHDSAGKILGILVAMSRSPFQNHGLAESILRIFAVRISAELEREYYITALKSSEQRFKDLAKNSPDIVYIIDLEAKKISYFNRSEILGYSAEELTYSEDWERIVHPDDVEKVVFHWKDFLNANNNVTHGVEYRIRNKVGVYEWVNNRHIVLERFSDGSIKQVLLNITIITDRKNAEEALRESEARLTALIENTTDILWSVDRDLIFTTMNSSFKKLFYNYYNKEIEAGNYLEEVLPDGMREDWMTLHQKALSGSRFSVELIIKGKSNDLSYEISYNPIYSDEGTISGVSVFGRDITERKNAENDIIRTNFELDSFVYRASHDLRAPLRSVLGLINLVKTEMEESERNSYLNLVEKSVNKLDTFISDLTNFSRNSRLEISVSKIEFSHIIDDCIENLKYMDNANKIKSIIQIEENAEFYSDRTRISIIFQNIISNSIKYLNPRIDESFVKIEITTHTDFATLVISDNGKGIREEYLDKIFNMFFRASQESYGSGLGLYITKQVVEKLNGTISVVSELGHGTRFTIRIPNLNK
jgi:PAS domain S-box-containing protein